MDVPGGSTVNLFEYKGKKPWWKRKGKIKNFSHSRVYNTQENEYYRDLVKPALKEWNFSIVAPIIDSSVNIDDEHLCLWRQVFIDHTKN